MAEITLLDLFNKISSVEMAMNAQNLSANTQINSIDSKVERVLGRMEEERRFCDTCKGDMNERIASSSDDVEEKLKQEIEQRRSEATEVFNRIGKVEKTQNICAGQQEGANVAKIDNRDMFARVISVLAVVAAVAAVFIR